MCKCQYQCSRYFTPKCMCDFATEIQTDKRISSCIVTVENSSKQPCNPKDYFLESQKFSKEMNREVMQKWLTGRFLKGCKMMQVFPIFGRWNVVALLRHTALWEYPKHALDWWKSVSLCFIVVEAGICCSMHRILCFKTKYESTSWIISERQKGQLLLVGSSSKWKRQSLERWWYVGWHTFLTILIDLFFGAQDRES